VNSTSTVITAQRPSTSHVKTQGDDVRVQHRSVERSDEKVEFCEHDGHGAIDDTIIAVDKTFWLEGVASIVASKCEGAVGCWKSVSMLSMMIR